LFRRERGDRSRLSSFLEQKTKTKDGPDGDGDRERRRDREFAKEHANKVRYDLFSVSKDGDKTKGVQFVISTIPIPRFVVRLIEKFDGMGEDGDMAKYSVGAGINRLIEFNDTISPKDSRSQVPFHIVRPEMWTPLEDGISTVSNGNITTKIVKSSLVFRDHEKAGNLNFTIQAEISSGINQVGDLVVTPSDVKYSVFIDNYNYQYENSKLMLVTSLFARNASVTKEGNNAIVLGLDDGAFFWSPSYTADGVEKTLTVGTEVVTDLFGEKQEFELPDHEKRESSAVGKIVTFQFDGAEKLVWDPQVGLASDSPEELLTAEPDNSQKAASKSNGEQIQSQAFYLFAGLLTSLFLF
jgi:hypothetical protein